MTKKEAVRGGTETQPGVFVHHYTHMLDAKRRLSVPTDWRIMIPGEARRLLVLPNMRDRSLNLFPAEAAETQARMQRFREMSSKNVQGRHFARTLAARLDLVSMDALGRIRIKEDLLQFAGLTRQVELVGGFDRIELWSPEGWEQQNLGMDDDHFTQAADYAGF
jgi:MraZ protein